MVRVLVPIAEGFEEIETAAIVDVLRRGGVDVTLAGLDGVAPLRGSRGLSVVPDAAFDTAAGPWDLVVLPGGLKNAERLAADTAVRALVQQQTRSGRPVAAICAAPLALDAAGVLTDAKFTCYPGVEARFSVSGRRTDAVVDAGAVVTSQGPGTSLDFALHLLGRLRGPDVRHQVARGLLVE